MIIDLRKISRRAKWLAILIALFLLFTSKWFWRQFYPFPYQGIIHKYANEFLVDPYLVAAIIKAESRFSSEAESYRGARGIMQIMPETGSWAAEQMQIEGFEPGDLYDPEINIRIGCWYLANLSEEFGREMPLVLAAYNAGRGNVRQWVESGTWKGETDNLEDIPFSETRAYVQRVIKNYEKYRWLYGPND